MFSTSFLKASDSIHRNTRMAGDTITTTVSPNATRPPSARSRSVQGGL